MVVTAPVQITLATKYHLYMATIQNAVKLYAANVITTQMHLIKLIQINNKLMLSFTCTNCTRFIH